MRRLANGTQVAALPTPSAAVGTAGYATNGDPAGGQEASIWDADQYNRFQEELMAFLTEAGITPSATNNAQVLAACQNLFGGVGTYGPTTLTMSVGGGLVIKCGTAISGSGGLRNINFPTPFTTQIYMAIAAEANAEGWGTSPPRPTIYGVQDSDVNGFTVWASRITPTGAELQSGIGFNWIAIGR